MRRKIVILPYSAPAQDIRHQHIEYLVTEPPKGAGWSKARIAAKYGLSTQRIQQICAVLKLKQDNPNCVFCPYWMKSVIEAVGAVYIEDFAVVDPNNLLKLRKVGLKKLKRVENFLANHGVYMQRLIREK